MRLSEAGDFKRLLPRSLHNPDHPDPKASPFIALLKQYMERVGGMSERPAFSTEDCCELEQESTTACTEIAQAVSQKQASASSRQRSSLQDDLSSSIATAVQALQRVHKDVNQVMPHQNNERKQEIQEQLALLFQIAEQCMSF